MGGLVPLGYDLEGRKLVPSPKEAELVMKIFSVYLEVGCVRKLAEQLDREKIRSKVWITRTGARLGGVAFARGALYDLLWYPGEHKGIVARSLWDRVQAQLNSNLTKRRNRVRERASSLLTGLVEGEHSTPYTPSFTVRRGRRYRYYVSQLAIKNIERGNGPMWVPAQELESRVLEKLLAFLKSDAEVFDGLDLAEEGPAIASRLVTAAKQLATRLSSMSSQDLRDLLAFVLWRIIISEEKIEIKIRKRELRQQLETGGKIDPLNRTGVKDQFPPTDSIGLTVEAKRKRCGGEVHLVVPASSSISPKPPKLPLVKAVARARNWYEKIVRRASHVRSLARGAGLTAPLRQQGFPLCASWHLYGTKTS